MKSTTFLTFVGDQCGKLDFNRLNLLKLDLGVTWILKN